MLIAPVTVGDRAMTGAGSVVTKDVNADTLVFGSMTAEALEEARRNAGDGDGRSTELDELATALRQFSAASYGRERKPNDEELDASLAAARNILRRLPRFHFGSIFSFGPGGRQVAAPRGQAWTR